MDWEKSLSSIGGPTVKARKAMRRPPRKILGALLDGLAEIKANWELEGFPTSNVESPQEEPQGEGAEVDGEDGDSEDFGPSVFDREDIEIAIDVFISHLVQEGIIRKLGPSERPSLSDIVERFFSEDHEISKKAREFEEHIKGYFDLVGYDDMQQAYGLLLEMTGMIQTEAKA